MPALKASVVLGGPTQRYRLRPLYPNAFAAKPHRNIAAPSGTREESISPHGSTDEARAAADEAQEAAAEEEDSSA